jgi:hypothetical protein
MRRETGMFVLAAIAAATIVGERAGEADCQSSPTNYRTFHPIDCLAYAGGSNLVYASDGQISDNSNSATAQLWCQAPHDSYLPLHSGATLELTVSGWNTGCTNGAYCGGGGSADCTPTVGGTSNMCARACRTFYGGSGGGCGVYKGDGGNGVVHINPALTYWNGTSAGSWDDTYYVDVFLCAGANSCAGGNGSWNAVWAMDVCN